MQGLLKRQVELHRPGHGAVGITPGFSGQVLQFRLGQLMQTLGGRARNPAASRLKKILLIHGLIGAAALEPQRAIGREQQQRLIGAVRFHHGRQQVGNSGAGGGHHSHSPPRCRRQTKGQKSSRPFIHSSDQPELGLISQQSRRHRQRS